VGNPSALLGNCMAGDLSACLGGANGAGFGWQDVDVYKVGAQWQASPALTLRAGYNLSDNPVRGEDVTINILAPGVVRHHVTLGATYRLDAASTVTGAFMYAFDNDVTAPSLFNAFVPLGLEEKIEMHQYSIG